MIQYIKYFALIYVAFYILINTLLYRKGSIGLISWFQLINVKLNLQNMRISAGSISLQIRPMYYLHGAKLKASHHDGLIVIHFYKLKLSISEKAEDESADANTQAQASQNKKNKKDTDTDETTKILKILKYLRWILPLTVVIHDFSIANGDNWISLETFSASFNCDLVTNESTKERDLRHSIHFSISNLYDPYRKVISDLKWTFVASTPLDSGCSIKFTKMLSSCVGHGISVNVNDLKTLARNMLPKKTTKKDKVVVKDSEVKPQNKMDLLDKFLTKLGKCEIYFAFDESKVQVGDTNIYLKNFVYSVHSADIREIYKKFATSNLYKITLNLSGLKVTSQKYKSTSFQIEFFNFLCIWDITSILFCARNIHDADVIKKITMDDSFIARNFLTITNSTLFTDVDDILKFKNEREKKKALKNIDPTESSLNSSKEDDSLTQNILRLAHKLRVRAQLLTTIAQIKLNDSINCQLSIDDILIDSSLSENVTSLFKCGAYYTPTRSLFTAVRNIQFFVNVDYVVHKTLIIDLFDVSCSVAMSTDDVIIDNVTSFINHIEFLAEEITLFKKLSAIAEEIVKKLDDEKLLKESKSIESELDTDFENEKEHSYKPPTKSFVSAIIHYLKFTIHKVTMSACFKNPVKYWDGEDQSKLNNYKRGVALVIHEFVATHNNVAEIPIFDLTINELKLSLIRDYDKEKLRGRFANILKISDPHLKYTPVNHRLSSVIPIIDATVSVEVLWSVIFVMSVLKSLTGRRDSSKNPAKKHSEVNTRKSGPKLDVLFGLPLVMIKLELPSQVFLAFELDSFQYSKLPSVSDHANIKFEVFRIYVQNPQAKKFWTLLAILSHTKMKLYSNDANKEKSEEFKVDCDNLRIEIPYQYVFYEAFDNLKAFFKSIKKLKKNFSDIMFIDEENKDFKVGLIKPSKAEKPLKFPKITIAAKHLSYCNNDDPFEEELTSLLMLGEMEQHIRMAKQSNFDKYEKGTLKLLRLKYADILTFDENDVALMPQILTKSILHPVPKTEHSSEMRKSFSTGIVANFTGNQNSNLAIDYKQSSKLSTQADTGECQAWIEYQREYHKAIVVPRNRLNANISKSWIKRVKASQKMKYSSEGTDAFVKVDPQIRKEFLKKYPVVVEGSAHALFEFKVDNCILKIDVPDFGLDNYAQFIHDTAGGVPKDTEYGILAPMHLEITGSEMSIQIKDYPLPMICFGGNKGDGPQTVKVAGDLVICEQMYVEDEIRHNFVPCVPQYNDSRQKDNLYAFHICRTMTNVKFITDLHFHVNSTKEAMVSWSPSFKPGLGYAFNSFDFLSKPPLDISPKIAFWDKFPLLIPSKFTFHLKNGIALFIKASQSPYTLIGKSAGMAFRWDKDVEISINKNGLSKDFMIVQSEVFEIVVPAFDPTYVSKFLNNHSSSSREYKIAKVLLRLTSTPIIWKLGFEFERNLDGGIEAQHGTVERSNSFRPHYDVRLRNPDTFASEAESNNWDSYEGWRSNYIYMAISLYSRDDKKWNEISNSVPGTAYNSLYLTPGAFFHFFYWWNSFKSSLGLPIKEGKMFKNKFLSDKKSPKFGASIFGISYTVDLSPLYITHVYKHASTTHHGDKVAFTGLKCFVKSFLIDLHQTRRNVKLIDEKNCTVNTEYKLKLDKGVVDFTEADLRILTAVFNQSSTEGMLARELGLDTASSTVFSDSDTSSSTNDFTERIWYDHNDFVELESEQIPEEEPKWTVHEFLASPRFYYVRDNPSEDMDFPFDNAETRTHDCELGNRDFSKAGTSLIDDRITEIHDQISFLSRELDDMSKKPHNEYVQKTINSMNSDLKELHHRLHILRCLKDNFSEGVFPQYDEFIQDGEESDDELADVLSKRISRVSSRVSSNISRALSRMSTSPKASSNYRNRFSLYTVNIKWTAKTKSGFLRYLENVKDRRFVTFSLSQNALNLAESLKKTVEASSIDERKITFPITNPASEFEISRKILEDIDQALHEVNGIENAETDDSYLIKLILPQISVTSSTDKCMLLTSNQIVLRSVTVLAQKEMDSEAENLSLPIETRSGLILTDAFLYAFDKEAILTNKIHLFNQKSQTWPPKLPIEMYYTPTSLDECVVIQNVSAALLYNKPNELHYSSTGSGEHKPVKETVRVIAPDVNVVCDSSQFESMKDVARSLFEHDDTEISRVKGAVKSFVKYSDLSNFEELSDGLFSLQCEARELLKCRSLLVNANYSENIDVTDDILATNVELQKVLINMNAIVDIFQSSKAKKSKELHKFTKWNFMASAIRILLVDENKQPFVEVSAVDAFYMFTESPTGESANTAYVYDFAVFDKHPNALYEQVLSRSRDNTDAMIRIDWSLLPPVGGIQIVYDKVIKLAPIEVEFYMRFAHDLQNFMFPKSEILQKSSISDSDSVLDLYDDLDSINSEVSSYSKLESVKTENSVSPPGKSPSKISKALHKFLHKNDRSSLNGDSNSIESRKASMDNAISPFESEGPLNCASNNVKVMDTRSGKYFMVNRTVVESIDLTVTFKGSGKYSFVNLNKLHVNTPRIEVNNKLMSNEEFFAMTRNKLVVFVLKNTHNIIKSSFRTSKSSKGASSNPSINPILKMKEKLGKSDTEQAGGHSHQTQTSAKSSHKHHTHTHRFKDTDLLGPKIENSISVSRKQLTLQDIVNQDESLTSGINENTIFKPLEEVDEEEEP